MGWFCPTFQRPERLAELALSWEKNQPGKPLHVRVWKDDPRRDDYFRYGWPDGWELYESDKEWAGDAFNEHFDWNPNDSFYGFIGDDIVLRTRHGLEALEQTAGNMFLAYPNDTVQRHRVATHFCLGGQTARALGFAIPRFFYHYHMDVAMMEIMQNCGLLRYCPQVIFQHKHFLWGQAERDETYRKVYGDRTMEEIERMEEPDIERWREWTKDYMPAEVLKLRRLLISQYERPKQWEEEDMQMMMEEYDGPVLRDQA